MITHLFLVIACLAIFFVIYPADAIPWTSEENKALDADAIAVGQIVSYRDDGAHRYYEISVIKWIKNPQLDQTITMRSITPKVFDPHVPYAIFEKKDLGLFYVKLIDGEWRSTNYSKQIFASEQSQTIYNMKKLVGNNNPDSSVSLERVCKEGHVNVVKNRTGEISCVTEQTKQKLIERGWASTNDSTLSKINTSCMTLEQSKETAPFFKTPSYLPEGYSYVCSSSGMPFESYIVYHHKEIPNSFEINELVSDGAIFIYQIDERNLVGEKKFQTYGSPEQRTRETYDDVMKNNPSLNPQLITINGMLAYAVDSCPDCGMQTANFTDGTSIQESTSTETRIKFIDENGVSYMLETTVSLQELIKVAESLQ